MNDEVNIKITAKSGSTTFSWIPNRTPKSHPKIGSNEQTKIVPIHRIIARHLGLLFQLHKLFESKHKHSTLNPTSLNQPDIAQTVPVDELQQWLLCKPLCPPPAMCQSGFKWIHARSQRIKPNINPRIPYMLGNHLCVVCPILFDTYIYTWYVLSATYVRFSGCSGSLSLAVFVNVTSSFHKARSTKKVGQETSNKSKVLSTQIFLTHP